MEDHDGKFFLLVFDVTSVEEASKSCMLLHEQTSSILKFMLYFSIALDVAFEKFLVGEGFSQMFRESVRIFPRKCCLMNNLPFKNLATKCATIFRFFRRRLAF